MASRLADIFKQKTEEFKKNSELRKLKQRSLAARLNPFRDKSRDMKNAQSVRVNDGISGDRIFDKDDNKPIEEIRTQNSTAIDNAKYNPKNGDMMVRFRGGRKYYTYPDCPEEIATGFQHANSKGRYFNENIKPLSINS